MPRRWAQISFSPDEGFVLRLQPGAMGMMPRMMPESTCRHLKAANKELLLALRSIIDRAIERTEEPEEGRRPRRIEVTIGGAGAAEPEAPGEPPPGP